MQPDEKDRLVADLQRLTDKIEGCGVAAQNEAVAKWLDGVPAHLREFAFRLVAIYKSRGLIIVNTGYLSESISRMREGKGTINLGIIVAGVIAIVCIAGGIVAIVWNAASPTEVSIWGAKVSTGSVGVAFVFIGVVVMGGVVKAGYKTLVQLADSDRSSKKT